MTVTLQDRVKDTLHALAGPGSFEAKGNLLMAFAGGSHLYGATKDGPSDLDVCGIFIEPRRYVYGLGQFGHFVTSTAGDDRRNTPDDIDVALYSLRRWAGLAAKGNPTALSYLFALNYFPALSSRFWERVSPRFRELLPCRRSVNAFRGFVTDQQKRLLGLKGQGKHGQRPELTNEHGYDTKAAMHSVRLCHEGIELMRTGGITYPAPHIEELKRVRQGEYSLDRVCERVSGLLSELDTAEQESTLPAKVDFEAVDQHLVYCYEKFYREVR